ncbi:MAG: TIGR01777 family oxidoreductase [Bacteroidetes bacterium]|nr:TIGR01777 family oxidoreductase [Bacteroidota bacterium]
MSKVLITGASGLIGSRLTDVLLEQMHQVVHLGRSARQGRVKSFIWDVGKQTMDASSLEGVDAIVHLAGAGVADKRWTAARKKEILESRIQSTELLFKTLHENKHKVKTLVAASAIGYYGFGLGDELFTEDSPPGRDFLAQVTQQWEAQVSKIEALGIRVVKIRVGIVLSDKGGALAEMARPIKWGLGAPLGTGKQMMSWIHIDDLCELFAKAITDSKMTGAYNGVAPHPVTNKELTVAMAKTLKKPLWLPNVPSFVLQLLVGEMGVIVVNGSNVSAKRVSETGFEFQYPKIESALSNLMRSS